RSFAAARCASSRPRLTCARPKSGLTGFHLLRWGRPRGCAGRASTRGCSGGAGPRLGADPSTSARGGVDGHGAGGRTEKLPLRFHSGRGGFLGWGGGDGIRGGDGG